MSVKTQKSLIDPSNFNYKRNINAPKYCPKNIALIYFFFKIKKYWIYMYCCTTIFLSYRNNGHWPVLLSERHYSFHNVREQFLLKNFKISANNYFHWLKTRNQWGSNMVSTRIRCRTIRPPKHGNIIEYYRKRNLLFLVIMTSWNNRHHCDLQLPY